MNPKEVQSEVCRNFSSFLATVDNEGKLLNIPIRGI